MTQTKDFLTISEADTNSDMTQVTRLPFDAETISEQLNLLNKDGHPLRDSVKQDLRDGRKTLSKKSLEVLSDMVDKHLPEGTDFQKGYFFGTMVQAAGILADKLGDQLTLESLQGFKEQLGKALVNLETKQN